KDRRLVHGKEDQHRRSDHPHLAPSGHQQGLRPDACGRIDPQRRGVLILRTAAPFPSLLRLRGRLRVGAICLLLGLVFQAATAAEPTIRVGSLRYGTLSWQLDVITNHGLDRSHGVRIEPLELAGGPAAQLALQAERVDLIVSDWLWVSRERTEGGDLTFIPFSSALGGLIVPAASSIRDVTGLARPRLGVAGSASDQRWLRPRHPR